MASAWSSSASAFRTAWLSPGARSTRAPADSSRSSRRSSVTRRRSSGLSRAQSGCSPRADPGGGSYRASVLSQTASPWRRWSSRSITVLTRRQRLVRSRVVGREAVARLDNAEAVARAVQVPAHAGERRGQSDQRHGGHRRDRPGRESTGGGGAATCDSARRGSARGRTAAAGRRGAAAGPRPGARPAGSVGPGRGQALPDDALQPPGDVGPVRPERRRLPCSARPPSPRSGTGTPSSWRSARTGCGRSASRRGPCPASRCRNGGRPSRACSGVCRRIARRCSGAM